MSIKLKIIFFQILVAMMLLSTAATTYLSVKRLDYYFDRTRLSREQMDTVIRLSAHMNRYSENIAELLLLGRTELDDFDASRRSLEDGLAKMSRLLDRETAFLRTDAERAEEAEERTRVRNMHMLFESIDLTTQRLMFLREQGQQEAAVDLFRTEIEERLDAELEDEIAAAIADEEGELLAMEELTSQLEQQLTYLVLGISVGALLISILAGVWLTGALTRPIKALIVAARAIGDGDLSHRIDYDNQDEFFALAEQLNVAATRLDEQRNELLRIQAGLETEVDRRTGQLEEANSRLQRLDQMRMLFLADIGHELRTPLTVLRGEAEVALRGIKTIDGYRETLQLIGQLTQQMGRLIDDLLFLSRAEVDAVRFEMQPLALQDVLEIALTEARVLAGTNGLLLHADVPHLDCPVQGDAQRLTQAFLIVLDNAVKYSDPGEQIDIWLSCTPREAVVRVRSIGPEIPASDLPFVFHRFYRGHQPCVRHTSGSGLGLPIAKWIVDTHGGCVELTSAHRQTLVSIHLPLIA
jgi:two-component system, OmpR family, sensor kinase